MDKKIDMLVLIARKTLWFFLDQKIIRYVQIKDFANLAMRYC